VFEVIVTSLLLFGIEIALILLFLLCIRKRKEWYLYEPVVDVVASEEDGKEEVNNSSR